MQSSFRIENGDTLIINPALHPSISNIDQIVKLLPFEEQPVLCAQMKHLVVGEGNRLSSFSGVNLLENLESFTARENVFRSLDDRSGSALLAKLPNLKVIDLSDNNVSRVKLASNHNNNNNNNNSEDHSTTTNHNDRSASGGLQVCMMNNSSTTMMMWTQLSRLVLSGNVLTEVPNLRQLPNLRDLLLDNNQLMSLSGIEFNLPSSLETFMVNNNQISDWACLVELAPFADSLHQFSIDNNPVIENTRDKLPNPETRFEVRLFLILILPSLQTLNGSGITDEEQAIIGDAWNQMSGEQLFAPGNSENLALFLHKFFPPGGITTNNKNQQQQQQQAEGGTSNNTAVNTEVYDKQFSKMNSRIDKIVEVVRTLRRDDLRVRHRAATTIQRNFRGALLRLKLSRQYSNYKEWRQKIIGAQRVAQSKRLIDSIFPFASLPMSANNKINNGSDEVLPEQVAQLQSAMKALWSEMAFMRSFLNSQRIKAVRTIQKFWRGFKARRKFGIVRDEFRRFANKFTPSVIKIQAIFRMFYHRRRFLVSIQKERRVTTLESEVSTLKQQVADLCKAFALIKPSTTLATSASPPSINNINNNNNNNHYSPAASSHRSYASSTHSAKHSSTDSNRHQLFDGVATSPHSRDPSVSAKSSTNPQQQSSATRSSSHQSAHHSQSTSKQRSYFADVNKIASFENKDAQGKENALQSPDLLLPSATDEGKRSSSVSKPSYVGITINSSNNGGNTTTTVSSSSNRQQSVGSASSASTQKASPLGLAHHYQQQQDHQLQQQPEKVISPMSSRTQKIVAAAKSLHDDFDDSDFDNEETEKQEQHDEDEGSPFGMRVMN